jgi:hypothetical protein
MNQIVTNQIQEYFKNNKYVVIKNFLDPNTVGLVYRYCITRVMAMDFKYIHDKENFNKEWDGEWTDPQAPGCYSSYGDLLMETLLTSCLPMMQNYTGLNLLPNYTYWRHYQKDSELIRHRDRHSCEISTTICLGYDTSNLDKNQNPDYCWPIWMEDPTGQQSDGLKVELQPGDMIIYRGCELDHWRDKFIGLAHAQLFMHYNEKVEENQPMFDGRPMVGIPKRFQYNYIN